MKRRLKAFFADPCARIASGVFGFIFLLAFLFVPCTKTVTNFRHDPSGYFTTKTTIPRSAYIFLPDYIVRKSRNAPGSESIRMKALQWTAVMAVVAFLGVFDIALLCRFFRKKRRSGDDEDDAADGETDAASRGESGFTLLR